MDYRSVVYSPCKKTGKDFLPLPSLPYKIYGGVILHPRSPRHTIIEADKQGLSSLLLSIKFCRHSVESVISIISNIAFLHLHRPQKGEIAIPYQITLRAIFSL